MGAHRCLLKWENVLRRVNLMKSSLATSYVSCVHSWHALLPQEDFIDLIPHKIVVGITEVLHETQNISILYVHGHVESSEVNIP